MITITLKNRGREHDRHLVTRIWFNGTRLSYMTTHDNHVSTLDIRDIDQIIDDKEAV